MDATADLNKTTTRYFVVVIDHFTKYIEAFALPDTTAKTVANTLVKQHDNRDSYLRDICFAYNTPTQPRPNIRHLN
jgi:hypothetical protein